MAEAARRRQRRGPDEGSRKGGRPRCAFCGRAQGETSALSSGPGWLRICNGCAYTARGQRDAGPGRPRRCSFCERVREEVSWIYGGNKVSICAGCVEDRLAEMLAT